MVAPAGMAAAVVVTVDAVAIGIFVACIVIVEVCPLSLSHCLALSQQLLRKLFLLLRLLMLKGLVAQETRKIVPEGFVVERLIEVKVK